MSLSDKDIAPNPESGINADRQKLRDAVENANLMIRHASEQGLRIDDALVAKVVHAKYLEQTNAWTEADEVEFWNVFRQVAQAIQPVTIDSILAANAQNINPSMLGWLFGYRHKRTLTQKAVQRYIRGALLSLVVMLVIHIYLSVGDTILKEVEKCDTEIAKIEEEKINQNALKNLEKVRALEIENDQIADRREKNIELLAKWLRPIDVILFNRNPADLSIFRRGKTYKDQNPQIYEQIYDVATRVTQSAKHPISVIGSYILPLFYGLLGAYAYILRVLFEEIRSITYSQDSDVRYVLRITLGAVAGLTVGLLNLGGEGLITSPLALAFIAGYSIEFVFVGIDRFIGNMNKTREPKNA